MIQGLDVEDVGQTPGADIRRTWLGVVDWDVCKGDVWGWGGGGSLFIWDGLQYVFTSHFIIEGRRNFKAAHQSHINHNGVSELCVNMNRFQEKARVCFLEPVNIIL